MNNGLDMVFYTPCNLTKGNGHTNEQDLIQDWVVVQFPPHEEGGSKRFECRQRKDLDTAVSELPPYPETDTAEWAAKTLAVRQAMVDKYVEYNFRPFLDAIKNDEGYNKAEDFCKAEAERLVPEWTEPDVLRSSDGPHAPVQFEPHRLSEEAQKLKFGPQKDDEYRRKAYDWSTSPLQLNNYELALGRFSSCYAQKKKPFNFNLVIPDHSRMFSMPEHEAILGGMLRKRSEITTDDGSPAQTWVYERNVNHMVDAATLYAGNTSIPSNEKLQEFRSAFGRTRELMIDKFKAKWFQPPTHSVPVGVNFGDWCTQNGFDPQQEAENMIPAFNEKYGFQHYPPKTAPGSSMQRNKNDIAKAAYDFFNEEGFKEISDRFAHLDKFVTTGRKNDTPGERVFIGTPLDVLWVEEWRDFYQRYKTAVTPEKAAKEPKGSIGEEAKTKVANSIPPESYLWLLVNTYSNRSERKREHRAAISRLRRARTGSETENFDAQKKSLVEAETTTLEQENSALDAKRKEIGEDKLSAHISEEEQALLKVLGTDELRFTYLNMKYQIDLSVLEEKIRRQSKTPKKLDQNAQTGEGMNVVQDVSDDDDDNLADNPPPYEDMEILQSDDNRVGAYDRDDIHVAYLDRIKSLLVDWERFYNLELNTIVQKWNDEKTEAFKEYARLDPNSRREFRRTPRKKDTTRRTEPQVKYSTDPRYQAYNGLVTNLMLLSQETTIEQRTDNVYHAMYNGWKQIIKPTERTKFLKMAAVVLGKFYGEFFAYINDLESFQGRVKMVFANYRIEPFMKPDNIGTWRVVKYNESNEELLGGRIKNTNVLHFYENEMHAIPGGVWRHSWIRVYRNKDPSSGDVRYSIYEPPEGVADSDGKTAWDNAMKVYNSARRSIHIEEFMEIKRQSKKDAETTIKEYAKEGLLTWDPASETIHNIVRPKQSKSILIDVPDVKARDYNELITLVSAYYGSKEKDSIVQNLEPPENAYAGVSADDESDEDDEDYKPSTDSGSDTATDEEEEEDGGGSTDTGPAAVALASDATVDGLAQAFERSAVYRNAAQRQWWGSSTAWWKSGY